MFFGSILATIGFYIILPFYFTERVIHKKSAGWKEKFGHCKSFTNEDKVIMLHACSVGEVTAIEDLAKKIKSEFPERKLVITTSTLTGQNIAKKKLEKTADYITYFPFDAIPSVQRFLNNINPEMVFIAETEIWPVFAYFCKRKDIPLYIINGRISDLSYKTYRLAKLFFKKVFQNYTAIYTQSNEDTQKFISIGVEPQKAKFMGNLKFGITKTDCNIDIGQKDYKIFIAGSTHKIENKILIDTYFKLKKQCKDLKLLLAPRHLERVKEAENICLSSGLKYGLRSLDNKFNYETDVIILDTLGELKSMYAITDLAFIGGSFNNTGGHNPLEAAVWEIPVVSGPAIFNFKDIYSILKESGAAKVVKTPQELYDECLKILTDKNIYANMKSACKNVFNEQKGAADFVINVIR